MKPRGITAEDLLIVIEEVSFGRAVIGGADRNGAVMNGYLDLSTIAKRLNRLYEIRNRSLSRARMEQAR